VDADEWRFVLSTPSAKCKQFSARQNEKSTNLRRAYEYEYEYAMNAPASLAKMMLMSCR